MGGGAGSCAGGTQRTAESALVGGGGGAGPASTSCRPHKARAAAAAPAEAAEPYVKPAAHEAPLLLGPSSSSAGAAAYVHRRAVAGYVREVRMRARVLLAGRPRARSCLQRALLRCLARHVARAARSAGGRCAPLEAERAGIRAQRPAQGRGRGVREAAEADADAWPPLAAETLHQGRPERHTHTRHTSRLRPRAERSWCDGAGRQAHRSRCCSARKRLCWPAEAAAPSRRAGDMVRMQRCIERQVRCSTGQRGSTPPCTQRRGDKMRQAGSE